MCGGCHFCNLESWRIRQIFHWSCIRVNTFFLFILVVETLCCLLVYATVERRDIMTMYTPLGLVRMCSLLQGGTNSVVHMVNVMSKVLMDYILDITMPFLENISIKGWNRRQIWVFKVRGRPHFRLWAYTTENGGSTSDLLERKVDIRILRDLGGFPPMWVRPSKTISSEGRSYFADEGRMQVNHRSLKVPWSVCLLPHLDVSLCSYFWAALWLTEQWAEVRMGRRARGGYENTEGDVTGNTTSPEGSVR